MKCTEFEEICIKNRGELDDEARGHLAVCDKCRRFSAVVACIDATAESARDSQTEAACMALVAANARRPSFAWHGLVVRLTCAAAALVLLGIVWCMSGGDDGQVSGQVASMVPVAEEQDWTDAELIQNELFLTSAEEISNKVSDLEMRVSFLACGW